MNIASSRAGQEIVDQAGHRAFVFKWNSLSDITATTSSPWHWAMSPTDLLPWRRIKRMKNQTSAPPLPETPDVSIHMMTRETRSMMALQLLTSVWTEIPTCSSHNLSSKDCTVFSNTPPQPSSPPPRGLPRFSGRCERRSGVERSRLCWVLVLPMFDVFCCPWSCCVCWHLAARLSDVKVTIVCWGRRTCRQAAPTTLMFNTFKMRGRNQTKTDKEHPESHKGKLTEFNWSVLDHDNWWCHSGTKKTDDWSSLYSVCNDKLFC